ncbi:MAG: hypothetical protein SH850_08970 [Planctomycetaceae bacterium]|nr:hypothetical protein [Planctomycetaceae bacterium]
MNVASYPDGVGLFGAGVDPDGGVLSPRSWRFHQASAVSRDQSPADAQRASCS